MDFSLFRFFLLFAAITVADIPNAAILGSERKGVVK
jgi:hypothetical protein